MSAGCFGPNLVIRLRCPLQIGLLFCDPETRLRRWISRGLLTRRHAETADEHWGDLVSIDLSLFPSLRCIMLGEFFATDPGIPVHPPHRNSAAPSDGQPRDDNNLWTLGSQDPAHIEVNGVARNLHAFDTMLNRPKMSSLARVEVDVDSTNIADLVRRSMPTVRGIISIYLFLGQAEPVIADVVDNEQSARSDHAHKQMVVDWHLFTEVVAERIEVG
ncbi:hypothetical protein B0H14DRAFT_3124605 [Mycena olivaceomarginata]|nr:hypothetical protein B0H14DRAFT_3124605 [Mycena olivaceomarginata]